jgi:hypothetical protein
MEMKDLVTVNFESFNVTGAFGIGQTFDEGISGVLAANFRAGGDWDAGTNPYGVPPGLYPRDDGPQHQFYTSRLDNVFWNFNNYTRLRTSKVGAAVQDKVSFDYTGMNQGPFSAPTTNV